MAFRTAVVIASFLSRATDTRGLGIIHLRDIRRFRHLRPTMITICRLAADPTPAQPVLVKSIPWRPD